MMAELFDAYRDSYKGTVEQSIGFSGLKHDFFLRAKADLLRDLITAEPGLDASNLRVLDIGCGVGSLHPYLRDVMPRLHGCDISHDSIERARHDNPSVEYATYDADAALPYAAGSFDLAFAVCVVHHVPPHRWPAFFADMRRVVRPGGLVCIIEHNPLNPLTRLAVLRCPFDEDAVLLGSRKARSLMREAALSKIESRHFLLLPFATRMSRHVEALFASVPLGAQYACVGRV